VVIAGIVVMTILSCLVVLPATLVALAVKLKVPAAVGVPNILPPISSRAMFGGRLPPAIDQVIGDVPVTLRI